MPIRIYQSDPLIQQDHLTVLNPEEIHHARTVLRLGKGSSIEVMDGEGGLYRGTIRALSAQQLDIEITHRQHLEPRRPRIILACALPKKSKFELILEKGTELGIAAFIPVITQRTENRLIPARFQQIQKRYQAIVLSACKQSGQAFLPVISEPLPLTKALSECGSAPCIVASLQGGAPSVVKYFQSKPTFDQISLFVGPEGDFTDEEYDLLKTTQVHPVNLGDLTLRTETAALTMAAVAHLFCHESSQ